MYDEKMDTEKLVIFCVIIYLLQFIVSVWANCCLNDEMAKYVTYIFPVFRLGDFSIGCCVGLFYLKKNSCNENSRKKVISFINEILSIVLTIIVIIIFTNKLGILGKTSFRYNVLFTPITVFTIYIFAKGKGIFSSFLSSRPLLWLANLSSACFLTHQVIILNSNDLINKFSVNCNLTFRVLIIFAITICFSKLFQWLQGNVSKLW